MIVRPSDVWRGLIVAQTAISSSRAHRLLFPAFFKACQFIIVAYLFSIKHSTLLNHDIFARDYITLLEVHRCLVLWSISSVVLLVSRKCRSERQVSGVCITDLMDSKIQVWGITKLPGVCFDVDMRYLIHWLEWLVIIYEYLVRMCCWFKQVFDQGWLILVSTQSILNVL